MHRDIFLNSRVAKYMKRHSLKALLKHSKYGSYSSSDIILRAVCSLMKVGSCFIGAIVLSTATATMLNPRTLYNIFIIANNFTNVGICVSSSSETVENL